MKCWLGHTRMDGLSGETKVLNRYCGDARSAQSHVCKDCGTHFSTIKKLDRHTIELMEIEKAKQNPAQSLYDMTNFYRPYLGMDWAADLPKRKGKRK